MTKRAAIYARVSTKGQEDGTSIETQIEACQAYAASKEYTVVGTFPEVHSSGETDMGDGIDDMGKRPALADLFTFLQSGGADVVIVRSLDRLARDQAILQDVKRRLYSLNRTRIEYVTMPSMGDAKTDRLMETVMSAFARFDADYRAMATVLGKNRRAKGGRWAAGPVPYGFRIDKAVASGVAIDEAQAEIVRQIFDLSADGLSNEKIAARLAGVRASRGAWSKTSVNRILRDPAYKGLMQYGRRRSKPVEGSQRGVPEFVPESEWLTVPCPAIVSPDTWERAQEALDKRKHRPTHRTDTPAMLAGMVYCSGCKRQWVVGRSWAGMNGRKTSGHYYRERASFGACRSRQLPGPFLDAFVWGTVCAYLRKPETVKRDYDRAVAAWQSKVADVDGKVAGLEKKRGNVLARLERLTAAFADGITPVEAYRPLAETAKKELADFDRAIAQAKATPKHAPPRWADIEAFAQRQSVALENATPEQQRGLLEVLGVRVEIGPDEEVGVSTGIRSRQIAVLAADKRLKGQHVQASSPDYEFRFGLPVGYVEQPDDAIV